MAFRINKVRSLLLAALAIFVAVRWLNAPKPRPLHPTQLPRGTVLLETGERKAASAPSAAAQSAQAFQKGPADKRDLSLDEARGGHTLARHVGRSDEELRERLALEEISAASAWLDRATAERIVALALARDAEKISAWQNRSGPRPNLALHYHGDAIIGRSLRPGAKETNVCRNAAIILKWAGDDWFVLTAYPEAR